MIRQGAGTDAQTQPTLPFQIVKATWRDLNDLRLLEYECFGSDAWPLIDLISVLTLPGIVRLKAVIDDKMAGFIGGDPRPGEKTGWITTLGVFERYRRRGIASALLRACEEKLPLPLLKLCVRRTNESAIALYFQHGYHAVDIWTRYYTSGEDALVLEKENPYYLKTTHV